MNFKTMDEMEALLYMGIGASEMLNDYRRQLEETEDPTMREFFEFCIEGAEKSLAEINERILTA
jgi:hypothetical protein